MNKNPEQCLRTKENLMEAFWELYSENPIEKITVKEITQKANYNRSTFYEYFKDTHDVLDQIEDKVIPKLEEIPPLNSLSEKEATPFNLFMKIYEKNSKYYCLLLGEKGDPYFSQKFKNALKPLIIETFLKNYKKDYLKLDFLLEFILSGMIGTMTYWFGKNKILNSDELFEVVHSFMKKGVNSFIDK
ncbi:MAG TPA: TetR/AcrR family transcriptional regulator [Tepiditoga sp.]|nr:TetR/AcrR family transcriptional regulator [Thermotogota bacterium]HOO73784.1 TetR/AcrR family transcriptional regulator [Tepiditoga sp.]